MQGKRCETSESHLSPNTGPAQDEAVEPDHLSQAIRKGTV